MAKYVYVLTIVLLYVTSVKVWDVASQLSLASLKNIVTCSLPNSLPYNDVIRCMTACETNCIAYVGTQVRYLEC